MLLQPRRVSLPPTLGSGRIRRARIGSPEGARHPADPGLRRLERLVAAVRRRQVHGLEPRGIPPVHRHGPPPRDENSHLCLDLLPAADRSGFSPGVVARGRQPGDRLLEHGPLFAGQSRLARVPAAADRPDPGHLRIGWHLHRRRIRPELSQAEAAAGRGRSARVRRDAGARRCVQRPAGPDLCRSPAAGRDLEAARRRRRPAADGGLESLRLSLGGRRRRPRWIPCGKRSRIIRRTSCHAST